MKIYVVFIRVVDWDEDVRYQFEVEEVDLVEGKLITIQGS